MRPHVMIGAAMTAALLEEPVGERLGKSFDLLPPLPISRAPQLTELQRWMKHVEANMETPWLFGKIWSSDAGWKVAWSIAGEVSSFDANWSKRMHRDCRRATEYKLRAMTAIERKAMTRKGDAIMAQFDTWARVALECIDFNKRGVRPADVGEMKDLEGDGR